jgi:hypothetical protein
MVGSDVAVVITFTVKTPVAGSMSVIGGYYDS